MSEFVRADSRNLPHMDMVMILEYFHTSDKYNVAEIRGVKTLLASRGGYVENAVGYVEIKRLNTECTVRAKVVPEHRITKKYYLVTIRLDESNNNVIDATCDGCSASAESLFPRFVEPVTNVTVTVGRDALLACVVEDLRGYKVAWVRVDTQTILSIHHNIITQNPRISLSYNDHRSWYLHIKSVQEVDRGWYMCQVNTDPMRSRKGYLQVVVPPVIIDNMTSTDMVVREGTNVTLVCRATGYPEPYVMWRREDGQEFNCNGEAVNVVDGENLTISKVSRLHMGAYLCIASNGVPPSISKRVMLMVQFPPMLSIPNQLEAAYVGQDVVLECHTEAYPSSINYWTTDRGDMIISGTKYITNLVDEGYSRKMKLTIRKVSSRDFSSYRCVAKNSLGETDGLIRLDEITAPPTTSTAINHVPTSSDKKKGKNKSRWRDGSAENRVIGDYEVEEWKDSGGTDYESTQSSQSSRRRCGVVVVVAALLVSS